MIDRNDKLSISRQAKLLGISRGSVYYLPQGASQAELALMRQSLLGSTQAIQRYHSFKPSPGQTLCFCGAYKTWHQFAASPPLHPPWT